MESNGDALEVPGRPRRNAGLQITDERLLWELQNEALGNDTWQRPAAPKPPKPQQPKAGVPGHHQPTAATAAAAASGRPNGGASNGHKQRQQQPAKRIKATLISSVVNRIPRCGFVGWDGWVVSICDLCCSKARIGC